jgi:hypothetical protein
MERSKMLIQCGLWTVSLDPFSLDEPVTGSSDSLAGPLKSTILDFPKAAWALALKERRSQGGF